MMLRASWVFKEEGRKKGSKKCEFELKEKRKKEKKSTSFFSHFCFLRNEAPPGPWKTQVRTIKKK
jgi:hypothetical protein